MLSFQRMEVYMLTIYFIHGKCVEIMLSYHLQLKVQCNSIYATKGHKTKGLKPRVQHQRKHIIELFFHHISLRRKENNPKPQQLPFLCWRPNMITHKQHLHLLTLSCQRLHNQCHP
jgi:hypothetical protein